MQRCRGLQSALQSLRSHRHNSSCPPALHRFALARGGGTRCYANSNVDNKNNNSSSSSSKSFWQSFGKEKRAENRAKLKEDLQRGYFDDFRELKETGGKVFPTQTEVTPAASAPLFPLISARNANLALTIPLARDGSDAPRVALVCLAFRDGAQPMVDSWHKPFRKVFGNTRGMRSFEVSMIESWLFSLPVVQSLLLRVMRASPEGVPTTNENSSPPMRTDVVYAFGNTERVRKALGITNRLSGYAYLLDAEGRVRWRACGTADAGEADLLISCTRQLLNESERTGARLTT